MACPRDPISTTTTLAEHICSTAEEVAASMLLWGMDLVPGASYQCSKSRVFAIIMESWFGRNLPGTAVRTYRSWPSFPRRESRASFSLHSPRTHCCNIQHAALGTRRIDNAVLSAAWSSCCPFLASGIPGIHLVCICYNTWRVECKHRFVPVVFVFAATHERRSHAVGGGPHQNDQASTIREYIRHRLPSISKDVGRHVKQG